MVDHLVIYLTFLGLVLHNSVEFDLQVGDIRLGGLISWACLLVHLRSHLLDDLVQEFCQGYDLLRKHPLLVLQLLQLGRQLRSLSSDLTLNLVLLSDLVALIVDPVEAGHEINQPQEHNMRVDGAEYRRLTRDFHLLHFGLHLTQNQLPLRL